jgi:hypothetical protein
VEDVFIADVEAIEAIEDDERQRLFLKSLMKKQQDSSLNSFKSIKQLIYKATLCN